jgi:hypothetical protein
MKRLILGAVTVATLWGQDAAEIAKHAYEAVSGFESSRSVATMVLKNSEGKENVRKLEMLKMENGEGDSSLIRFILPADIKDTRLLTHEVIGGDDKQWLYLPALKRAKRISSSNKSGSFMASEFSYEDIASQHYRNYTYPEPSRRISTEKGEFLEIVRVPRDEKSGYSRQVVRIDPATYLVRSGRYFDRNGRLLKEVTFARYEKIGSVYRIREIIMDNVQNGKSSRLILEEDHIGVGLGKSDFSKRVLR